jgi:hypothetical protein
MSPKVHEYSTGVCVDRAEKSAQCIIKADNEDRRADRLQVLRHKTHPEFFAGADDKNGDKQDDEIAFEPEEIRKLPLPFYACLTWRLHSA